MNDLPPLEHEKGISNCADIIAWDRDGRAVLLVAVTAGGRSADYRGELTTQFNLIDAAGTYSIPYIMTADYDFIQIYDLNYVKGLGEEGVLPNPQQLPSLSTSDILSRYNGEFGKKRIFYDYLVVLVRNWLEDIGRRWKFEDPPGYAELARIGLASRLEGGTIRATWSTDDHLVR